MTTLRTLVIAATLVVAAPLLHAQKSAAKSTEPAVMLDALITGDKPWEASPDQIEAAMMPQPTQWLSTTKDSARFFGNFGLWDGAIPVKEAVIEFQGGPAIIGAMESGSALVVLARPEADLGDLLYLIRRYRPAVTDAL